MVIAFSDTADSIRPNWLADRGDTQASVSGADSIEAGMRQSGQALRVNPTSRIVRDIRRRSGLLARNEVPEAGCRSI